MSEKRRDNKNRILRTGESQRADGKYMYRYVDANGKTQCLYSWRLVKTDTVPEGKRDNGALRDIEKRVQRDMDDDIVPDGDGYTVLALVEKYISQKTGVKNTTRAGYGTVINVLKSEPFGKKRIDKVKLSDAKAWLIKLQQEDHKKVNLERPKVLYNSKTGKFVLWVHYENGKNYSEAACAIATCEEPDGDYTYHGHFNPLGYMSRDCTLYQEPDGTAYFISAARNNADMHIYRLQDDYMNIDVLTGRLWQGEYREAPAIFQRGEKLYMLSSFCTGWDPNQGKYATADNMEGRWSSLEEFGDATTYDTQPAYVLTLPKGEQTRYLYISDRWDGKDYNNSRYVFLYLEFDEDGKLKLDYQPEFHSSYVG